MFRVICPIFFSLTTSRNIPISLIIQLRPRSIWQHAQAQQIAPPKSLSPTSFVALTPRESLRENETLPVCIFFLPLSLPLSSSPCYKSHFYSSHDVSSRADSRYIFPREVLISCGGNDQTSTTVDLAIGSRVQLLNRPEFLWNPRTIREADRECSCCSRYVL